MIRPRAAALVLIGAVAAASIAQAADPPRPRTQPSRDVEVIYQMTRGDQQLQQRSRWQAATGRQRIDAPGAVGRFVIADPKAGIVTMVSDATHQIAQMKAPAGPLDGGDASFTRLGTLTIAGLPCTEWAVVPARIANAEPNQICLTDDGVLLGIRANDVQRAKAVRVTYGPTDPAAFVVPADYQHVTPGQPLPPPKP